MEGTVRRPTVGRADFGYSPFGSHVHEERRFGDLTLPSRVSVGWTFETPRYEPFYEAVLGAEVGA